MAQPILPYQTTTVSAEMFADPIILNQTSREAARGVDASSTLISLDKETQFRQTHSHF